MKKIVLCIVTVLLFGTVTHAQNAGQRDCAAIVRDYLITHGYDSDTYPADKAEFRCQFSSNAFYLTDDAPDGYFIFQFTDLTNLITGEHPAPVSTLDLNTFSYYTYDFNNFHHYDFKRTIYFDLDGRGRHFLAMRPYEEILDRTDNPQKYKD